MPRPEAILFDLDCTLTDRRQTVAAFAAQFVHRFASDLRADADAVASVIAEVDAESDSRRARAAARLRDALDWSCPPRPAAIERYWADTFPTCTRPAAGLTQTLDALRRRGFRLGIVSNGGATMQQRKLDALGIRQHFAAVVISGAVGVRKPARAIYAMALDALGVSASAAWFVGDQPVTDVRGAADAGLTAVWFSGSREWPGESPPPRYRVDRLPDLLDMVQ